MTVVHNSDTLEFANLRFPRRVNDAEQYFNNVAIQTILFAAAAWGGRLQP